MTDTNTINHCSFCAKHKDQVVKLIVGRNVAICNECVDFCQELLIDAKKKSKTKTASSQSLDPRAIHAYLNEYVVGQDSAKMVLSVAIANHYKRIRNQDKNTEIEKTNILMLGPTGSGKTLLAKSVARYLDVPFVVADATSLTEAGYVGDDVESVIARLYAASGGDVEKTQRGIVFLDEIDKIRRQDSAGSRDVSGEGVQNALLTLLDGRISDNVDSQAHAAVDTSRILFVCTGAFVGLQQIVEDRLGAGRGEWRRRHQHLRDPQLRRGRARAHRGSGRRRGVRGHRPPRHDPPRERPRHRCCVRAAPTADDAGLAEQRLEFLYALREVPQRALDDRVEPYRHGEPARALDRVEQVVLWLQVDVRQVVLLGLVGRLARDAGPQRAVAAFAAHDQRGAHGHRHDCGEADAGPHRAERLPVARPREIAKDNRNDQRDLKAFAQRDQEGEQHRSLRPPTRHSLATPRY